MAWNSDIAEHGAQLGLFIERILASKDLYLKGKRIEDAMNLRARLQVGARGGTVSSLRGDSRYPPIVDCGHHCASENK